MQALEKFINQAEKRLSGAKNYCERTAHLVKTKRICRRAWTVIFGGEVIKIGGGVLRKKKKRNGEKAEARH